ncbi:helix-turn-helix domain-containing protein [Aerophototrophica crusticola]|uniref:Helix-turn-helix domain-containing protein n=1 Tax=Aerophototrophica crusticola TaxID=1709002 RepID=A0A858R8M0_9PROT|nr:helix-turn-helix domain-containing protein [Rhodospirillaceae bacterium B3]
MDARAEFPRTAGRARADAPRGTFRPIRALLRGLECLAVLNGRDGASVTDVAAAVRLPRTTAHRILETLCEGGFAVRDASDERYRVTIRVRSLSDGFGDQSWIREMAKPALEALGRRVLYPVSLVTPAGLTMLVRETTDRQSPLALERYSAGSQLPMAHSACGRLYLALSTPVQRAALLDVLQRSLPKADAPRNRPDLERELDIIRTQGYAIHHRTPEREATVAVPIQAADRGSDGLVGILSMRYIASALTPKEVVGSYLAPLVETAARIAEALRATSTAEPVPA